ncbi:MAG: PIG-L family deacetylase [Endomicrobium sp.]|jgi:LmbE family N-acetylglucosaminyl deacetylase|nr:PIG-L family deacetylase [Endomicrobium sp.]
MSKLKNSNAYRLYEFIQPFLTYNIPLETELPENKVLVLAPHQCDEAIGCAGALLNHSKKGGVIEIAYCTNDTPERMKEAEKAASLIGAKKNHFLQFPIKGLKENKEFCESLIRLFDRVQPEVVFLPFWFDNHHDHVALSKALIKIRKKIDLDFVVYAYCVWSPLIPNCLFDISSVWKEKQKVIECYKSQMKTKDLVRVAEGLDQYWGEVKTSGMQYAEPFFMATAKKYFALGRKIF